MPSVSSLVLICSLLAATGPVKEADGFREGRPDIKSISALTFGPDGILFVGDSKGGSVYALDLKDRKPNGSQGPINVPDLEQKLAALMGTQADDVLVHDMAVNPISQNVYLSVSRGRTEWSDQWLLPNDFADAHVLLRISPQGSFSEVDLQKIRFSRANLPKPVDETKTHQWKEGISLRVDMITDMVLTDGKLLVAGLSNEEFSSSMWQIPYPFKEDAVLTTLEIFHGAHGKYETHAPIRAFLPIRLNDQPHVVAAYLCTPLVTFPLSALQNGKHIKGRTVAEFGSGNYPLDMVRYRKGDKEFLLIANNNLPLMIVDPSDIEKYQGSITRPSPTYTEGVGYAIRATAGVQHLDVLNSRWFLVLQRQSNGRLHLQSLSVRRF